jgi:hypothetical protein
MEAVMSSENTPKTRPYWHVDAKWLAGLVLAVLLNVTLVLSGLAQFTDQEPAVEVLTKSTALMFSPNGLDDETDIEIMRLVLALSPDGAIQPIPGMDISVRAEDIEGLTSRQIRLNFFQQWAEVIYQGGVQGLADLADDAALKEQILEGGAAFNLLTLETHRGVKLVYNFAIVACFFMLIPLVIFSYRFGRLGSPGCVLFFASLPGALIFSLVGLAVRPAAAPVEAGGLTGLLSYWVREVLPSLARTIDQSYLIFLALGVGLMLLAGVLAIVWRLIRAFRQ